MQRLNYAFRLIKAHFCLAIKNPQLRRPWGQLWMGGAALVILWLIPLGVSIAVFGLRPIGLILLGFFSFLLLVCLLIWGEITSLTTCRIFVAVSKEGKYFYTSTESADDFNHWQDIALWTLMQPGLMLIRLFDQLFRKHKASEYSWVDVSYLMLPLVALEDLTLGGAKERIMQIKQENLIGFNPQLIPIRLVSRVINWIFILGGGLLGFWAGITLANPATASVLSRLLALACAIFIAGILALVGILFSSFNQASYHTTLYQWAMNAELVRHSGDTSQSIVPEILSQVMRKKNK